MKSQKPKIKPPLSKKAEILFDNLKTYFISNPFNDAISERIGYVAKSYKSDVMEEMIKRSISLEQASWKYSGYVGFFSSGSLVKAVLVVPKKGRVKYIVGVADSGQRIIASLPYSSHKEIAEKIQELTNENIRFIRGGFVEFSTSKKRKKLLLSGESQYFGKADHKDVARLLSYANLEAEALE